MILRSYSYHIKKMEFGKCGKNKIKLEKNILQQTSPARKVCCRILLSKCIKKIAVSPQFFDYSKIFAFANEIAASPVGSSQ